MPSYHISMIALACDDCCSAATSAGGGGRADPVFPRASVADGVSPGGTRCGGKFGVPARHVAMPRAWTPCCIRLVKIAEVCRSIGVVDQPDGLNAQDPRPNESLSTGRTKLSAAEQHARLGPCLH